MSNNQDLHGVADAVRKIFERLFDKLLGGYGSFDKLADFIAETWR